jgi:hypothetical protein
MVGRNSTVARFFHKETGIMHVNLAKGELMSRIFVLPALLALALLPGAANAGRTELPSGVKKVAADQYYGPWQNDKENYFHRKYFFKVKPTDKEYQEHEVISYKKGPRFFYYYSPESGQFWGRGFFDCHGNEQYQFLQPGERSGNLQDINFNSKPVGTPPNLGAVNPPPAGGQGTPPGTPARHPRHAGSRRSDPRHARGRCDAARHAGRQASRPARQVARRQGLQGSRPAAEAAAG